MEGEVKGYFITGTDTGVGKTYVTVLLTRQFIAQGLKVAALKPVASGARLVDGQLRNDDALQLHAASNVALPYDIVNPYCLTTPVSPHIAAQQDNVVIEQDRIEHTVQQAQLLAEMVLVEGVGGWYAPLSDTSSVADLAKRLQLPVILVVGLRLGCMNHAVLTARAIESSGCQLAGWIGNVIDPAYSPVEATQWYLEQHLQGKFLGLIPHGDVAVPSDCISLPKQRLATAVT